MRIIYRRYGAVYTDNRKNPAIQSPPDRGGMVFAAFPAINVR
jgi:hypothetical protein